jgi:F0F1-type ATP synthase epsilon subunit
VLRGVLDQAELLTQAEIALAAVHLASADRIAGVTAEASRLRSVDSRAASAEQRALNQRLATAEQENQRLRAELEDALQKLEAITTIERSIREQE